MSPQIASKLGIEISVRKKDMHNDWKDRKSIKYDYNQER